MGSLGNVGRIVCFFLSHFPMLPFKGSRGNLRRVKSIPANRLAKDVQIFRLPKNKKSCAKRGAGRSFSPPLFLFIYKLGAFFFLFYSARGLARVTDSMNGD